MILSHLLDSLLPGRLSLRPFAILVLLLSASGGPQVCAATIQVTNFAEDPFTSVALSGTLDDAYLATSFVTGNDGYLLHKAAVLVRNPGTIDLTVELSLWTDVAGLPGTQFYVFPTATPTLAAGANNTRLESTASGVVLASNTAYWLAMRGIAGNALTWVSTTSLNQTSPSGWTISDVNVHESLDSGTSWGVTGTGTVIPIFEIEASPIPEPGSLFLSAAGLAAGCVFLRVRRKAGRQ